MKKIINGLLAVSSLMLAFSCADYNETYDFTADADPAYNIPYADLNPVKSYINRDKYPNMSLGAMLKVADFNKQELAHAAAITNFNNVSFGSTLMSGAIISERGIMNFLSMMELLNHMQEINGEVYGSPIVANADQADKWLKYLTSPIEIQVDPVHDMTVDYTTMEEWTGTSKKGKPVIQKNFDENGNALKIPTRSKVYIAEGFDLDPLGTYTITFLAQVTKDETVSFTFCDSLINTGRDNKGDLIAKKFEIKEGGWKRIRIEDLKPAEGATYGYMMMEGNLNSVVYLQSVEVDHAPDNHRPQTEQEKSDTIRYALNAWCDGLMKYNEGRIKSFDLIGKPLDNKTLDGTDIYDLKHAGEDEIFWQDILGSENYAPEVSKIAQEAFVKYGGNADDLKFFISESGLDETKKMNSLKYWMNIWEQKGAKIDGINAELNLTFSEDAAVQKANKEKFVALLKSLKETGKMIRLSNFDIKYQNAEGVPVTATAITAEQRQLLANYNAELLKEYMNTIPNEKQAGICKSNMVDSNDPVGLWTTNSKKDWVRTATYKAFCDVLSGKE
jgi:hypothetical protein